MAELPYFPFYPKDFLGDRKVATMSLAARGLYITLLAFAWHEDPPGSIPNYLISNLGVSLSQAERDSIETCFYAEGDRLFQKRMVFEYKKLAAKKQAQSEGGRRAMEKRYNSDQKVSNLQLSYNKSESESDNDNTSNGVIGGVGERTDNFRLIAPSVAAQAARTRSAVRSPMMTKEAVEEFMANPAYSGIDVKAQAWKFKNWCEANHKTPSRKRFVNWLNRV